MPRPIMCPKKQKSGLGRLGCHSPVPTLSREDYGTPKIHQKQKETHAMRLYFQLYGLYELYNLYAVVFPHRQLRLDLFDALNDYRDDNQQTGTADHQRLDAGEITDNQRQNGDDA